MRIEEEARSAVDGDRGESYGDPKTNHTRTALLWNAYIGGKYDDARFTEVFTAEDVCVMNGLQKISRGMHVVKRDNYVDRIGYIINEAKLEGMDE